MTDERIAAIEAEHVLQVIGAHRRCATDHDPWPCDTAILLARLREVEQERDRWRSQWESDVDTVARSRDAAEAERDAVNEAALLKPREYVRVKAERDAARADAERSSANAEMNSLARTAAEERARSAERNADRLAEALRGVVYGPDGGGGSRTDFAHGQDTLAAHDRREP